MINLITLNQNFSRQAVVPRLLRGFRFLFAGFVVTAMVGCAGVVTPKTPEETVTQLATQRWKALIAGDFDKAYELTTPSYRQIKSAANYRGQRQGLLVKWISAEVVGAKCDGPKCEVFYKLQVKPIGPFRFDRTLVSGNSEIWVLEGGQWWAFEEL